jgi:hypothetical protein
VAALKICASNFEIIESAPLLCLSPDLFVGVVRGSGFRCNSEVLSERVVSYLQEHCDEVNGDLVGILTSSKNMPRVNVNVAFSCCAQALSMGSRTKIAHRRSRQLRRSRKPAARRRFQ